VLAAGTITGSRYCAGRRHRVRHRHIAGSGQRYWPRAASFNGGYIATATTLAEATTVSGFTMLAGGTSLAAGTALAAGTTIAAGTSIAGATVVVEAALWL